VAKTNVCNRCLAVVNSDPLEVVDGKNSIETENIAGVITTLEVLRTAVDAGELDARIEAVSGLLIRGSVVKT
jgi:hypothetical protein